MESKMTPAIIIDNYGGDTYFVKLTDDQLRFYEWLNKNDTWNSDVILKTMDEFESI